MVRYSAYCSKVWWCKCNRWRCYACTCTRDADGVFVSLLDQSPFDRFAMRAIPDWPREAMAYSRGADTAPPRQSACSPGTLWPVTSGRHRLEQGQLGEVIYGRSPGPLHRSVLLLWIWTWGAAYCGLAMSSEDRHRVGDVVAVSPWRLRSKIRPAAFRVLPPLYFHIAGQA